MIDLAALGTLARNGLACLGLVALCACTTFSDSGTTSNGVVTEQALAVPEGTDPEDAVIGLREHPRILAAYGGVYADRPAEIMLARIVGRLLTAAEQPNTKFTVTILDSSEVNAFALPGGYVYVTRGILALASDASELAAVLAHEIAHVTLRHARARTNKARTTEIADRVATSIFGGGADSEANAQKSLAAFSQAQELEADREGIKVAGKAGYDPYAAARFLSVMGRFARFSAGDAGGADFLSSHPSTPDRIAKASEIARSYFGPPGSGETDWAGYLTAIDGLNFGDSPQQGAILGNRYVQPALKFTFTVPSGYTLQNAHNAVVGVAGDGEAVRFDSAEVPQDLPLAEYLKSGWIAGLDAATITSETSGGLDMASGIARTAQWAFRVGVVRYEGQVFRFIFAAKADNAQFAQGADATLKSFRAASTADLAQVRKVVVQMVVAGAGDTADSFARRMAGLSRGSELFYILNDLYPGDALVAGKAYKVVVVR